MYGGWYVDVSLKWQYKNPEYLTNNKIESGLYYKLLKEFEKPLIIETLKFTNNNKLLSSQLLGINRNTLRKKMEDYEIQVVKNTSSD